METSLHFNPLFCNGSLHNVIQCPVGCATDALHSATFKSVGYVLIARDPVRQRFTWLVGYAGGAQRVKTYAACCGNSRKLLRKYSRKMYADTSAVKGTRWYGTTGTFLLLFSLVDLLLLLSENLLLSFLSLFEGDSDSFSGLLASPSSTRPAGSHRAACVS